MPAYDGIAGPVRGQQAGFDGKQPGDPAKAAAAILTALGADTPLRLPLGSDAADAIAASLDTTRAELAAWAHVTRGTDHLMPLPARHRRGCPGGVRGWRRVWRGGRPGQCGRRAGGH